MTQVKDGDPGLKGASEDVGPSGSGGTGASGVDPNGGAVSLGAPASGRRVGVEDVDDHDILEGRGPGADKVGGGGAVPRPTPANPDQA